MGFSLYLRTLPPMKDEEDPVQLIQTAPFLAIEGRWSFSSSRGWFMQAHSRTHPHPPVHARTYIYTSADTHPHEHTRIFSTDQIHSSTPFEQNVSEIKNFLHIIVWKYYWLVFLFYFLDRCCLFLRFLFPIFLPHKLTCGIISLQI